MYSLRNQTYWLACATMAACAAVSVVHPPQISKWAGHEDDDDNDDDDAEDDTSGPTAPLRMACTARLTSISSTPMNLR